MTVSVLYLSSWSRCRQSECHDRIGSFLFVIADKLINMLII